MMPCSFSYPRSFSNPDHDPHIVLLKNMISCDCRTWSAVTEWPIYVYAHYIRKHSHIFSRSKARWIISHDPSAKAEIFQKKTTCGLPRNVQAHAGSSGSEADVCQPHSQVQASHLTCPIFYQLWLFCHSPLPPLLQFLASDNSRCCKNQPWQM